MKWIIIIGAAIVGIVVLLVIVNPVLIAISSGPGSRIDSKLSLKSGAVACDLLLRDAKEERYITQLDIPRAVAEKLKIEAPQGFRVEELADAKSDQAWLKNWNRENLRFAGRLKIAPEAQLTLLFPAKASTLEGVEINGQFETGKTFGNMISFFKAKP